MPGGNPSGGGGGGSSAKVFALEITQGMGMGDIVEVEHDEYPIDGQAIEFSSLVETGLVDVNSNSLTWTQDEDLGAAGCKGHFSGNPSPFVSLFYVGSTVAIGEDSGVITALGADLTVPSSVTLDAAVPTSAVAPTVVIPSALTPGIVKSWKDFEPNGGWRVRRKPGSTTTVQFKFGSGGNFTPEWLLVRIG